MELLPPLSEYLDEFFFGRSMRLLRSTDLLYRRNIGLSRQQCNVLFLSAFQRLVIFHRRSATRNPFDFTLQFFVCVRLLAVVPRAVIRRAIDQAQRFEPAASFTAPDFPPLREEINQWQRRQKCQQEMSFTCSVH